jgi:hypothetical protein
MLGERGQGSDELTELCRQRKEKAEAAADEAVRRHKSLLRRYQSALERRRRASGLPSTKDLDRIQKYEAHLERGLHKTLDRLHELQEARGALRPRAPAIALAVVQTRQESAPDGELGPLGSFAIKASSQMVEADAAQVVKTPRV